MAKELPYFKFEPSEWMFGRIQKQPANIVVVFINLCCKYWHELGSLELETVKLDFGDIEIESLVKNKIIIVENGFIRIKFLDRQFDEIDQFSKIQSVRGKLSAEKRSRIKSTTVEPPLNHRSTTVQPPFNQSQPIIEDKIIEEEKREEENKYSANTLLAEKIIKSSQRMMAIIKQFRAINIPSTEYDIKEAMKRYLTEVDARSEQKQNVNDLQNHFVNWAAKKTKPNNGLVR